MSLPKIDSCHRPRTLNSMKNNMTPSWDLIGPSARLVRDNFWPFTYLILLPGLLYLLGSLLIGGMFTADGKINVGGREQLGLAVITVAGIWTMVNIGPVIRFHLQAVDKKISPILDYYRQGLRYTLPLIGLYIVFALLFIVGLILFIIPAFFVLHRLILAPYYLVDKQLPIIESLKQSARDAKKFSGPIWGVIGVQIAVSFAAGALQIIPIFGIILGQLLAYSITFMLVLRFSEIRSSIKADKTSKPQTA